MNMRQIQIESWPRKKHYEFFKGFDSPHFNITGNIDVTKLYNYVKSNGQSFFKFFLYGVSKTANEIPEFKHRMRGDTVVEHDVVHPSFTVMGNHDVFDFCDAAFKASIPDFIQEVTGRMNGTTEGDVGNEEDDDLLYITSVPWITFTSIMHPTHEQQHDSAPRIAWGKFTKQGDRVTMPLSVQAHHSLLDGIHIGKYFEMLQAWIDGESYRQAEIGTGNGLFDEAIRLRENGELEKAKHLLLTLLHRDEKNARLHAHCAWCYDALGEERQAVPHYERAIRLGLTGEELSETYIGLGSTYRALGRYEEAEQIFEKAIKEFPDIAVLKVFQAITRYNLGRQEDAMGDLLELLVSPKVDNSISRYRRALTFYARKLNETWE